MDIGVALSDIDPNRLLRVSSNFVSLSFLQKYASIWPQRDPARCNSTQHFCGITFSRVEYQNANVLYGWLQTLILANSLALHCGVLNRNTCCGINRSPFDRSRCSSGRWPASWICNDDGLSWQIAIYWCCDQLGYRHTVVNVSLCSWLVKWKRRKSARQGARYPYLCPHSTSLGR